MTKVKICGISEPDSYETAIKCGADFVGFVFYPDSPRYMSDDKVAGFADAKIGEVTHVGLFVDPQDSDISEAAGKMQIDMIQLHGHESPERVSEIRHTFGKPVIKALKISNKEDLGQVSEYESAADWLMFDACPLDTDLPGGTGQSFDWAYLEDYQSQKPWFLAGGLTPENVPHALSLVKPIAVDVSSGVEKARGVKDPAKIEAFIKAVKEHEQT